MLRELSGEDEADRGLDLARRDGRLLVVRSELRGLAGCERRRRVSKPCSYEGEGNGLTNPLENVVDERVEDEHGLVRDTRVGVDLLQDLVDVRRVGLLADTLLLLLVALGGGRLLDRLLRGGLSSGSLRGGGLAGSRRGLLLLGRREGVSRADRREGGQSGDTHFGGGRFGGHCFLCEEARASVVKREKGGRESARGEGV